MSAGATVGSLADQLRALSPDSVSVWQTIAREKSPLFRAAVESLLAAGDLHDPATRARLSQAGSAYCAVTRDSVLLADLSFLTRAEPSLRTRWLQAVLLDRRGTQLRDRDPKAAISAFLGAIRIYADIGYLRREAVVWGSLGTSHWNAGDRPRASDCYRKALVLREQLGDPLWIGRALNTLGSAKQSFAEYDSALVYYEKARAVREKIGHANDLALTLAYIGNVHYQRTDLQEARQYYLDALRIAGPGASPEVTLSAREGLANVLVALGELGEAAAVYREVLALREKAGQTREAASTRTNLARVLGSLGDPAGALAELDRARTALEEVGDIYTLTKTLSMAGSVQSWIGNFPEALKLWQEGLRNAEASGFSEERVQLLINIGYAHGNLGENELAMETLDRARALADSLADPRLRRDVLSHLASAAEARKEYARAIELHEEALSLDRESGDRESIALDLGNLGINRVRVGLREEGLADSRAAADLARDLGNPEVLWKTILNIADAYEESGDLDSARVQNDRAVQVMESVRTAALGEEAKAEFLRERAFAYEAQVQVLAKLHAQAPQRRYSEAAWGAAERGKARAMLDILEQARIDLHEGAGEGVLREEAEQERALSAAGYRLRRAQEAGASEDSLRLLREGLEDRETSLKRVEDRLRLSNPKLATMDPARGVDLAEVRSTLLRQDGALLLEYALGDSGSYLWAVTKRGTEMFPLPAKEAIQKEAHRLRRVLEEDGSRTRGRAPTGAGPERETWETAAGVLCDMVLGPVAGELARAREVIVVPDGALQYVPFELLMEARFPGSLGKKSVRYGPSAAVLAQLEAAAPKSKRKHERSFLGVGDPQFAPGAADSNSFTDLRGTREARFSLPPLPYTRKEVESIGELFGTGRARILLGVEARESALAEPGFLSGFRILHFATHGLTDEQFPMRSALALSFPEDPSQDGFLTAAEIYRLHLDADLVVLSACETGKGKMVRGEGVLGLPRAFLYAGARNVVVSLWSVSDEATAVLMADFYKEMIARKRTPAEALARAKTAMIESEEWNHPFYWAGFVLLGPG